MMLSNKVKFYIYIVFLFVFTYLFAGRLIHAFTTNGFDYIKLAVNVLIIGLSVFQIVRYSKKINQEIQK